MLRAHKVVLGSEPRAVWWDIRQDDALAEELQQRLIGDASAFVPTAELVPPVGEKCYIDKRGEPKRPNAILTDVTLLVAL